MQSSTPQSLSHFLPRVSQLQLSYVHSEDITKQQANSSDSGDHPSRLHHLS